MYAVRNCFLVFFYPVIFLCTCTEMAYFYFKYNICCHCHFYWCHFRTRTVKFLCVHWWLDAGLVLFLVCPCMHLCVINQILKLVNAISYKPLVRIAPNLHLNWLDFEVERSKVKVAMRPDMVKKSPVQNAPSWRRQTVWQLPSKTTKCHECYGHCGFSQLSATWSTSCSDCDPLSDFDLSLIHIWRCRRRG